MNGLINITVLYKGTILKNKELSNNNLRRIVIGSGTDCDIVVNDEHISNKHLEIFKDADNNLFITDLDSTNGVYLDGIRIPPNRKIRIGQKNTISLAGNNYIDVLFSFAKQQSEEIDKIPIKRNDFKKNKLFYFISILLLFLSIIFFVLGLYYPILSTKKQFWKIVLQFDDVRLYDSIKFFYQKSNYVLAAVILFFTIIFPVFKYIVLINNYIKIVILKNKTKHLLSMLDKWSMLDVFLVALIILNYKMDSDFVEMKIKAGTYFLIFSIVLRMLSAELYNRFEKNK